MKKGDKGSVKTSTIKEVKSKLKIRELSKNIKIIDKKEESELEEEVENEVENSSSSQFQQFMNSSFSSNEISPILSRQNQPRAQTQRATQENENLEREIGTTPRTERGEKDENKINYDIQYTAPDYISIEEEARKRNTNMLVRGSERVSVDNRTVELRNVQRSIPNMAMDKEIRDWGGGTHKEDYVTKAERVTDETGLPFERKERKYKGRAI